MCQSFLKTVKYKIVQFIYIQHFCTHGTHVVTGTHLNIFVKCKKITEFDIFILIQLYMYIFQNFFFRLCYCIIYCYIFIIIWYLKCWVICFMQHNNMNFVCFDSIVSGSFILLYIQSMKSFQLCFKQVLRFMLQYWPSE